jgi:hypothetical protein
VLGFAVVAPVAANDGGYWPTTWGWTALGLCWVAALALILQDRVRVGIHERLLLLAGGALLAWILLGLRWTSSAGNTVLEAERVTLFVAAVLAAVLVVRSRSYRQFLGGIFAAIWLVSTYALATRLFPDRLGVVDPIAAYRLSEPLGYWNALGIFAAIGSLLALGFAVRGRTLLIRALAASSLLTLLPTLYFTFSRGAWLALGLGLVGAVALDPRRLHLIGAMLALIPAPAAAVAVAYQSDALTQPLTSLPAATHAGHDLALVVVALSIANALIAIGLGVAERRLLVPREVRIIFAAALVLLALAGAASVFVRYGGPVSLTQRAYDSFTTPLPTTQSNLKSRLFSLSSNGRIDLWKTAWAEAKSHRAAGSGAGTYEQYWLRDRPYPSKARDAHSVYVETLAELGPVGLALLLGALAVPAAAALGARRRSLVPTAFGAYLAFVVHAGVDWDWEMTAVTLTALFCGVALIVAAHTKDRPGLSTRNRLLLVTATLALAAFAFVGLVGNSKLAAGTRAADSGRWALSETRAREAMGWMPWSGEPWRLVGESQLARRQFAAARRSLETAISKDPRNWELWLDLSLASKGDARRQAARRALGLNPFDAEVTALGQRLQLDQGDVSGR